MPTLTIGLTAFSVQSAKSANPYGQLAKIPLKTGAAGAMFRAALAKIPSNATITSAKIRYQAVGAQTGTFTLQVYRLTGPWPSQVTWARRPTRSALIASTSVTNPAAGAVFDVTVTSTVQQLVAGTLADLGWYIEISQSTILNVRGTSAASGKPVLIVTYTVPPPVPTNLQPSDAAISVGKPVLLFDADPNITSLQVQVDPAANGTTPAYDSTQQAATGGLWDLSATAYAGLAAGASTFWRCQQWTTGGPSGWSPWAAFSRTAVETLTITSPSGVAPVAVADGTPPVMWTFSGTQTAWRVRLLSMDGDVIADSLQQPGTDVNWTPPKGLTTAGQHGLLEVTVWPAGNRAATPGAPVESIATLEVVLTPDGTVEVFTTVTAKNLDRSPTVTVTGHRSAIPDFVVLLRDGAEVDRWAGASVCAPASGGGYTATVTDPLAVVNRPTVYALVAVVNDKQSASAPARTFTPRCMGIWLTRIEDGARAVLWDANSADQSQPETAFVHRPINQSGAVVRRRLMRSKPEGNASGLVVDVGPFTAADSEANLRSWAEDGDAGDLYSLQPICGSGSVIIGDLTFSELVDQYGERMVDVAFNWWGQ